MILNVENGSFGYSGETILNNINFSLEKGEVLSILGPNGAGKTTLLKCIAGLLKWKNGHTFLNGTDISAMHANELWRYMAYVPQAKSFACSSTVQEFILLGRSSRIDFFSRPSDTDISAADNVINRLGIEFLRNKKCNEISGGELQMVLIAKALASEPQILILDEPESNLDFKNQLLVLDTISSLSSDGMSCIFNTHYPSHALRRADKAILLGRNSEILYGNTASVITEKNIEKAFGVKTVIGEVETEQNILKDIIPLSVTAGGSGLFPEQRDRLAVISMVTEPDAPADINTLLHEYHEYVAGRTDMPYPKYNADIINIVFDAPSDILEAVIRRLNLMPNVSVKAVYAKD